MSEGEALRLTQENERLREIAGLMADPVINKAVNDHIAERYKTIKPDSCGSCAHKLYETGDCLTGRHVVVEWHDKLVWFSPDGDGVEVEEYPNRQTELAAELAALREEIAKAKDTAGQ